MEMGFNLYQLFGYVFTASFNMFLLFLIFFTSSKTMGFYRDLLIFSSCSTILFSVSTLATDPHFHIHRGAFVTFRYLNDTKFSKEIISNKIAIFCGFFGFIIALFGAQFVYRYGVVQRKFYQKYLSGKKVRWLFLIPSLFGAFWTAISIFFYHSDFETDDYLGEKMYSIYHVKMENILYSCIFFYHSNGNANTKAFLGLGGMVATMIISFTIIIYFGLKCYRQIKNMVKFGTKASFASRNLQEQLFQALLVQVVICIFLIYIPAGTLITFPIFSASSNLSPAVFPYVISSHTAITQVPVLVFVKSYRNTVLDAVGRMLGIRMFRAKVDCVVAHTDVQPHLPTI